MERSREHESSLGGYEHEFERAAEQLSLAVAAGHANLTDAQKLRLYALFKQASDGDCVKPQPSAFQPMARAKWNAWQSLQGMDATVAKRRYVLQVIELLPSFRMPTDDANGVTTVPVDALSYAAIVVQLVGLVAFAGALLFTATRVILPFGLEQLTLQLGDESARALLKSLTPVFWFALGYLFVAALRSRIFSWRLLSGEFVWLDIVSPRARVTRARHRLLRRVSRAPPKSPTTLLLEKFGVHVVDDDAGRAPPHLELVLPENPDAVRFGDAVTVFPFTLEQTANVFYRKFKEPLPDPSSPQLVAITVLDEHRFEEFDAVFRRRKIQFKNNAPYLIKRQFAASEFVEYIEDSLLDQRNRTFYVYTRNESFQSFGTIEDFAVYRATGDAGEWTELSQGARLHITNSSIGFLRSTIESLASTSYAKNMPRTREYHQERLCEEFGTPESLLVE